MKIETNLVVGMLGNWNYVLKSLPTSLYEREE
jgi:hypothetical protein